MRQVLEPNPALCLSALLPYYELQSSTQWSSVYRLAGLHHMVDRDPSPHTDIAQACSPGILLTGEFEWVPRLIRIGFIGRGRTAHHQTVCILSRIEPGGPPVDVVSS